MHEWKFAMTREIPGPVEIGFDIDGVVADTMDSFLRIAHRDYGIEGITKDRITSYWLEDCLPVPPDITTEIIGRLLEDPFGVELRPVAGAREVLSHLGGMFPLVFVTARPVGGPIEEWLRALLKDLPSERIHVIATGKHDAKVEVLRKLGVRCFVEDHLETCRAVWNAGIKAVVFDQPWNQGEVPFPRVRSWEEIMSLVERPSSPCSPFK